MSVATVDGFDDVEDVQLVRVDSSTVAAINKTEVEAQLDSAHKYPRSINRFQQEALSMATVSEEVAQSCIYSLPRGGKPITGPSIRLAEICASAWGNIHIGARPVEVGDTDVTSQGVAWDLQKNYRVTVESKRRITGKNGQRFNEDMIIMTQNAANSIALRNAIFRVIPRAYVDQIYAKVREVAVGNASTLAGKRAKILDRLAKMGADQIRVLSALNKVGVDDIGLEELETLIGYGTPLKEGTKTVDDLFPAPAKDIPGVAPAEQGRRVSIKSKAPVAPVTTSEPAHDPKTGEVKNPGDLISPGPGPVADFVMSTPRQRKELGEAIFGAKISDEDVCEWFSVAAIEKLSGPQVVDALERIAILESQGK